MNTDRTDESSGHLGAWSVEPTSSRASSQDAPLATVFTEGPTHRVRHTNAAFCLLAGQSPAEIVDHSLGSILRSDDRAALRGLLDRVFETGMPNVVSDVAWHDALNEGLPRYFTAIASPVVSELSGERGLLVQVLDTTERVLARAAEEQAARDARVANEALVLAGLREHEMAEAALREKERWNALVESLAEGITVLEPSGLPTLVSSVGREILDIGSGPAEHYNRCTFYTAAGAAIPPERHPGVRALAGERFTDEEHIYHLADGSRRRLLFSGSSVRDERGEVVLAINAFRDVTALRQLEETREEYVALISHDLRNPLHTLLMNSQLLIERLDADGKDAGSREGTFARAIERGTRRLASMVDELYRSSQLESGKLEMRLQPVAPEALLTDSLEGLGASAEERARIVVETGAEALPKVTVDIQRMQRAIVNLLTNALKYSNPGSRVAVALSRTSDEVTFAVVDQGPGIAPEDLPRVFEKYHRARVASDREGMGLGLYITRRIVEAHGGRVAVESVVGRGSTFRITLPVAG